MKTRYDALEEQVTEPGWKLVNVKAQEFDDLMFWLDRCDSKGHLENCYDLVQPWAEFDYRGLDCNEVPRLIADVRALAEALNAIDDAATEDDSVPPESPTWRAIEAARAVLAKFKESAE